MVGRRLYKGNICRPPLLRGSVSWWLTAGVAITQSRVDACPGQPSARGTPRSAIPFVSVRPVSPSALGSRGQPPLTNSFFFFPSPAHVSSHIRPFTLILSSKSLSFSLVYLWRSAASWTSSHPATVCFLQILRSLLQIPASFHATCYAINMDRQTNSAKKNTGRE